MLQLIHLASSNAVPIELSHFLGPFAIGKLELDGDPTEELGGIFSLWAHNRSAKERFTSELLTGGARWTPTQTHQGATLLRPNVDWNGLVQSLSSVEVKEVQGWAVGRFHIVGNGGAPQRHIIACAGVANFFVDGPNALMAGDLFRSGTVLNPTVLAPGEHTLYARARFKVETQLRCTVSSPDPRSSPLLVSHGVGSGPDAVAAAHSWRDAERAATEYAVAGEWISISLTNLDVARRVVRFAIAASSSNVQRHSAQEESVTLAAGQAASIPFRFKAHVVTKVARCPLTFSIIATLDGDDNASRRSRLTIPVSLRCRTTRQSFVFSFLDHDGSVSSAAAIAPLERTTRKTGKARRKMSSEAEGPSCLDRGASGCPVMLSLHGTGVSAVRQADSYKYKKRLRPKEKQMMTKKQEEEQPYIFGVEHAWLLAPTRHGAHNWEYTGALTALRAVEALDSCIKGLSAALPEFDRHVPLVDTSRILFSGHSMGGHGTWGLAINSPDRALGVASIAGWIKKESYGDSNVFFKHDIAGSFTEPALKALLEAAFSEHDANLYASNLRGIPVLARVGVNDRAVPPWEVRRMTRVLRANRVKVQLDEVEKKEHWWWDTKRPNDGGVLNDRRMRAFYRRVVKDGLSPPLVLPAEFELALLNPASSHGRGGFRVLQQRVPFRISRVRIEESESAKTITVRTVNVLRMAVDLSRLGWPWLITRTNDAHLIVDGRNVVISPNTNTLALCSTGNSNYYANREWQLCEFGVGENEVSFERWERGPRTCGPARMVFASPFTTVVGTSATTEVRSNAIVQGATFMANMHAASTGTYSPTAEDAEWTRERATRSNAVLVGGPHSNRATARLLFHDVDCGAAAVGNDDANHECSTRDNAQLPRPPIVFDREKRNSSSGNILTPFRVGPCRFDEPGIGIVFTIMSGWDDSRDGSGTPRISLVFAGTDAVGLQNALKLAVPTIPPMMRAPLTNAVPDFLVTGPKLAARGSGGILAAGFWGNKWEWVEASSYARC